MKISAVAACRNSFSFLSDHGVCHTHLFYIQSRIPSLAMSVVMFVSELLSGTFPSDVFLKTCQGWRFTLKMVRHQKGPFLIRAILIILEKKKKNPPLVGWSEVKTKIPITLLCSMASYSLETQLHFSPLASYDLAPKFSVSLAKHAVAIFVA